MNALYISYDGLTEPLGRSQILPYVKELSKKGISFTILTFDKRSYLKNYRNIAELKQRLLNEYKITWISLRYHKSPSAIATIYDVCVGLLMTIYLIVRRKIEILHCRSYVPMLIGITVRTFLNKKAIFDMRGLWPDEKIEGGIWREKSPLYRVAKFFEKKFIINSDKIVVLTSAMKTLLVDLDYVKHKKTPIDIIPTCVDLKKFHIRKKGDLRGKLPIPKENSIFIYSGSIGTVYMVEEIIKFLEVIIKRVGNSHLLMLTHGDKEGIINEANKLGINEYITVMRAENDDLPSWLSLGKAGIAFYKPGYSMKGRSPTKLWEYLACGLPVVINSGIGDCDSIIYSNKVGVIIDEFSTLCYEKAIDTLQNLLSQPDIRQRCRDVAEKHFSLEKGVERYLNIYKKL